MQVIQPKDARLIRDAAWMAHDMLEAVMYEPHITSSFLANKLERIKQNIKYMEKFIEEENNE